MAEEPEQVLEQHRVAAALGVEEAGAEVAVGEQHGDRTGEHRHGEQQQERGHQDRPREQRHLVHGHAGRAHCFTVSSATPTMIRMEVPPKGKFWLALTSTRAISGTSEIRPRYSEPGRVMRSRTYLRYSSVGFPAGSRG